MCWFVLGANAANILVPMDEAQRNHLKAYGIAFWTLQNDLEIRWLLNYKGGSFLLPKAIQTGADIFITADMKYHEFFDADNQLVIADIGHWESEQFTVELLIEVLQQNFPTFAVLKSGVKTNPVRYFL